MKCEMHLSTVLILCSLLHCSLAWSNKSDKNEKADVIGRSPQTSLTAESSLMSQLRSTLQDDKYVEALNLLRKQVGAELKGSIQLEFIEGFLLMKSGQNKEAEIKLKLVLEGKSGLAPYAAFYLGKLALEAGNSKQAEEYFMLTETFKPQQKLWNENALQLIQIEINEKNWTEIKKRISALEQNLRREPDYPKVLWLRAQADLGLGNKSLLCASLRKLYSQYPQFSAIQSWGHDLAANEFLGQKPECTADLDDFRQRIRLLIFHGEMEQAEKEVLARKSIIAKQSPFDAEFLYAQYLLQRGEATRAVTALKPFVAQRRSDEKFQNVLASALARAGEHPAAVGIYDRLAKESGKGRMALEYRYRAGVLCYQTQDYDCAVKRFHQILKINASSRQGLESRWHLAWIAYLKGRFSQALAELDRVPLGRNGRSLNQFQRRVVFWRGVTLLKLKKNDRAKEDFNRLLKEDANGFYGLASRSRINQLENMNKEQEVPALTVDGMKISEGQAGSANGDLTKEGSTKADSESQAEMNAVEKAELASQEWEEQDVPIAGNEGGQLEQGEVGADNGSAKVVAPKIDEAFESKVLDVRVLATLGLEEWARWELYEVEKSISRKSPLRRRLVKEYQALEMYHRSSLLAANQWSGRLDGKTMDKDEREMAEATYPLAFFDSVQKYSQGFEVPSEFILSIMRAESSYRSQAVSPVGALGLMQVMPSTGRRVADMLKESGFEPRSLLHPDNGIRYGSRYLQRMLRMFSQNMVLASAAYNAGPHRVKQWLSQFGELEVDEFIEHIPYIETRNYVKKVLAFTLIYRNLYKDKFDPKRDPIPNLAATLNVRFDGTPPVRETWEEI